MVKIDPDGLRAPYLQLADALRARIEAGEFPPGRKVPSQTELEQETGLSRNTVKKALDVLKNESLLITAPGRGLFVAERQDNQPT
ncbi:GntR family transcriptional regulator [Nonomuraea sp. K274]|uniref:GntR family transcriptional regulator n=1 Tax=Nonomuraea cypriaca TaxID=1187855 RepID=A0A931ACD3_9ACTN|nr:GntR family transcriptional regulator [Nonomuraea cypriaca]